MPYPPNNPNKWDTYIPDGRWTSFEAEAWPLSAWRYDISPPRAARQSGFFGWGQARMDANDVDGLQLNVLGIYGHHTIFASASVQGAQHFLFIDSTAYNFHQANLQALDHGWAASLTAAALASKRYPYLYRLKTDTHNSVPFRDLNNRYPDNFKMFPIMRSRDPATRMTVESHAALANDMKIYRHDRSLFVRTHLVIDTLCQGNDEIHLRGRLKTELVDGRPAPLTRFDFVGAEWLDPALLSA